MKSNDREIDRSVAAVRNLDIEGPALPHLSVDEKSAVSVVCPEKTTKVFSPFFRFIKRFFDIVLSSFLLVVLSPLFLICYIAVKWGGGSAIYKQARIGKGGKSFKIYKFRSMREDAEKEGPQLSAPIEHEERLTKVGRFLRSHHLDELPQLWNVFIGDMSFVGPRPERKYFIDKIMEKDKRYECLYAIRPGVTSYATLYNGYTDTLEKMLKRLNYDLYYLEHASVWFDLKIIFLTFISIFTGRKI